MEGQEKIARMSKTIIQAMEKENCTVQEAEDILQFVRNVISATSPVQSSWAPCLTVSESEATCPA